MRYFILIFLFAFKLFSLDATLKIEKDVDNRAKVSIYDESSLITAKTKDIYNLLREDMTITSHFKIEGGYSNRYTPNPYSAKYLLKYRYSEINSVANLSLSLIDVASNQEIFSGSYKIPLISRYPFLVHKAVTELNSALGYESVDWLNRYIVYDRYIAKKKTEIILADFTFRYKKRVIKGGLTLFPCWGDSSQRVLYFSDYNGELPTLKRLDLYTGRLTTITSSEGMLACSDVSRDGNRLLLTMAPTGQTDIYEYNLLTNSSKRLTLFSGIDVNGKYLSNETKIVFVSNRLGYPNLFVKDLKSQDVEQLVYSGKNNNSCDTYNDKVVFIGKANANTYNVYLIDSDRMIKPLTTMGVNQFPRFSSDGKVVAYFDKYRGVIHYQNIDSGDSLEYKIGVGRLQSIDW